MNFTSLEVAVAVEPHLFFAAAGFPSNLAGPGEGSKPQIKTGSGRRKNVENFIDADDPLGDIVLGEELSPAHGRSLLERARALLFWSRSRCVERGSRSADPCEVRITSSEEPARWVVGILGAESRVEQSRSLSWL